jgi:hypothetical protein
MDGSVVEWQRHPDACSAHLDDLALALPAAPVHKNLAAN